MPPRLTLPSTLARTESKVFTSCTFILHLIHSISALGVCSKITFLARRDPVTRGGTFGP